MAATVSYSESRLRAKKHIQAWRKSGLSKIQYSRLNGIPSRTFFGWCKRHFSAPPEKGASPNGGQIVELVPVPLRTLSCIKPSHENRDSLSIHFGQHFRIIVTQDFSPALLDKVIRTLEGTR